MDEVRRKEIISFAIKKLTHLIDPETGKIKPIPFKQSELMKSLGLENKSTLTSLSDKQIQHFINAALEDADCWDLFLDFIEDDWNPETGVPHLVAGFCIDFTLGRIQKPKKKKTTNSRDFVFLMLAEVISRTFKINFSCANDVKGKVTFTALDAIAKACREIENFQDALQFSNLSKLRTQNQNIAYLVDNMLKKYGYYTKRAFKNTQ